MPLKDLTCTVLQLCCSVLRKEKGLKNERTVAVYTWQGLYVAIWGFCLQITVISPSNAWNGRGFWCSPFCLCNPHVMWIPTWYLRINLSSNKNLKCTSSPGRSDMERLLLPALFIFYVGLYTICRSYEHLKGPVIQWETTIINTPKNWAEEKRAFLLSLISSRFIASCWGISNWQSQQLNNHKYWDTHSCFYLSIHNLPGFKS